MIVFDLACTLGHRFEGWFASSSAFADQQDRGLILCPHCGSNDVMKAPMAPSVPAKSNTRPTAQQAMTGTIPPELVKAMKALADAQSKALKHSTWVGERFAHESRAMHYGERDQATIHGQATREEAVALADEGIAVVPLPFPVAPPDEIN
ncbi:DUF1178 family protein [Altererythrobacter sp. TH136]|uniref:DUF1178 family protein n=1 Tax=Altererythrobacter sp. TH136 TaxID=2067415 RepID=UPI001164E098|nr:DUF1178 family protein [Altererythrobacter sp. TH136]QDM39954.1 DUF1178 family protein [Altererythrobacter sp. TH136]